MPLVLPDYPVQPAPAWCEPFIGLPYERGARGPVNFDCWGLLMLVLSKQFGLAIPAYEGVCWSDDDRASRVEAAGLMGRDCAAYWAPVRAGDEQPGDGVLLRICGAALHVGVVALPGLMLHSAEGGDSAVERYDNILWRNRVEGLFRFKGAA